MPSKATRVKHSAEKYRIESGQWVYPEFTCKQALNAVSVFTHLGPRN